MALNVVTQQSPYPIEILIPFSIFSAENQSIQIAHPGVGPGQILSGRHRLMDVLIHKETAFDTNSVVIGSGAAAGSLDTIATAAEVAATTAGVSKPANWRAAGKFADLLLTADRSVYARLGAGDIPTVGSMRLTLIVYDISPRAVL